jgi:hypothetical protein
LRTEFGDEILEFFEAGDGVLNILAIVWIRD